MTIAPVAQYAPDSAELPSSTSDTILNVIPRTLASYGPFPDLTVLSTALTARCQGGYGVMDTSGNAYVYAGDATKLYELGPGTITFTDKSGATYGTPAAGRWSMTQYGTKVIATNGIDAPQFMNSGGANFAALITSGVTSITAKYVTVVKDFLVFGNTVDGTDGARPQRVWWSAINDSSNFPILGTSAAAAVQSDAQDLVGDAGWVQGIVGNVGPSDGLIFQERGITRMFYQGTPLIFSFVAAEGLRGTPAPGSIIQLGSKVFYLGEDGFYVTDGMNSVPIGKSRVDKTFFADLDQALFHRISAAIDPQNSIVYWAYPGTGHSGNCNRILIYNWDLDRWSITDMNAVNVEILLRTVTLGYSVETLDNISTNLDTGFSVSFDDRFYTGGRVQLSAFDVNHKLNYFTGSNLAATIDTSVTQLFPGKRGRVNWVRPMVEGTSVTPSVSLGSREVLTATKTQSTAVAVNTNGDCSVRVDGRYLDARVTIPAGSTWTHMSGIDVIDPVPLGNR